MKIVNSSSLVALELQGAGVEDAGQPVTSKSEGVQGSGSGVCIDAEV